MPTSRFWGYYDYLQRYYANQQPVDKREQSINKAKDLDWAKDIKNLKNVRFKDG